MENCHLTSNLYPVQTNNLCNHANCRCGPWISHPMALIKKTMTVVPLKARGEPVVVSLSLPQIDGLSSIQMYIPKDLLPVEARENTLRKVEEVLQTKQCYRCFAFFRQNNCSTFAGEK